MMIYDKNSPIQCFLKRIFAAALPLALTFFILQSCEAEIETDHEERRRTTGKQLIERQSTALDLTESDNLTTCQSSFDRGQPVSCAGIWVTGNQSLTIAETEYFDSRDFADKFANLIISQADEAVAARIADIILVTNLQGDSFADGFAVSLVGDQMIIDDTLNKRRLDEGLQVDSLLPGAYTLRIAKDLRYQVKLLPSPPEEAAEESTQEETETSTNQPGPTDETNQGIAGQNTEPEQNANATDTSDEEPTVEIKTFCASLFHQSTILFEAGNRTNAVIRDFEIKFFERECQSSQQDSGNFNFIIK